MRRNLFIIVYLATVSCLCVASSADHKPLDVEVRQAIEELMQIIEVRFQNIKIDKEIICINKLLNLVSKFGHESVFCFLELTEG